jgi:hypothetical protein
MINLGQSKVEANIEDAMTKLLATFCDQLIKAMQDNLVERDRVASKVLHQSIDLIIGERSVSVVMADYWKFVDKGVQGNGKGTKGRMKGVGSPFKYKNKMPPLEAFKKHIMNRGISIKGYSDKKRSLRAGIRAKKGNPIDQAAWAMAKHVQMYGIDGVKFYSDVVNDKAFGQLVLAAEKLLGKQVIYEIRK